MQKLLVAWLVLALSAFAQTAGPAASAPPAPPPVPPSAPVIKQLRETVSFIQLLCQNGADVLDLRGTGFFVFYPDQRLSKDGGFVYLVTNRHVAECWDEDRHPMRVKSISIRVNLTNGASTLIPLNAAGNIPWTFPADDSVDLALFPLLPDQAKVEYKM